MNIGFYSCLALAVIFALITLTFKLMGKKAAILISGFNSLPKSQRERYDTEKMSKDHMKAMLLWTIIMAAGALLSFAISQYFAVLAFGIWLVMFLKDAHINAEKAFGKYKFE
jgi:hypothetical protein